MTSSARRLAAAAAAALAVTPLAAASASADTGNVSITLGDAAARTLRASGVDLGASAPAAVQGRKLVLRVGTATVTSSAVLDLDGSLSFGSNGRRIRATDLEATLGISSTRVTAKLGGRRVALLTGAAPAGALALDATRSTATLSRSDVALTGTARSAIARALAGRRGGKPKLPSALGTLRVTAQGTPRPAATPAAPGASGTIPTNAPSEAPPTSTAPTAGAGGGGGSGPDAPASTTLLGCTLPNEPIAGGPVTSGPSNPAEATALPSLTSPTSRTGVMVWRLRTSFVQYVSAGGQAPYMYPSGVSGAFPFAAQIETGPDPKAVVAGIGTLVFCYPSHGFVIALTNPTVVVDGANSRLIVTVGTQQNGVQASGRTDFATLPNATVSGGTVLTGVPVLTAEGAKVFGGVYSAGTELDAAQIAFNAG